MNLIQDLLTINEYSRPGTKLKKVQGIVVHWVANPNTSAKANRNFFENRKNGKSGYGSAHYLIDLNGSVILAIPPEEVAYHVGAQSYRSEAVKRLGSYPNGNTLGIECTHVDWNGKMTDKTYESLILLCAELCKRYNLNPLTSLYRHYDITGKDCHKWFVNNPAEWEKFKKEVQTKMTGTSENKGIIKFEYEGRKFEIEGIFKDGTNYTPARTLLESLGFNVGWDNQNKTVLIKKKD
ncbi:N-acetylmuramoyl-L-alanine amidase [Defluviitalea saccharophila]|uniref:N-acetylmuramoyl-L-alanine amidase n=1 Tax=Defluviitalea saccharophila TaxID=879970 RepID=A0ABZ2Y5I5_9FIRM